MLKHLLICAALTALATGSANAQQREAVLQKIALPNAGFDIVVAMVKPDGAIVDLRGQPDPTIAYIAGGKLVIAIDDQVEKLLKDIDVLRKPSCSFDAHQQPVSVFVVPK